MGIRATSASRNSSPSPRSVSRAQSLCLNLRTPAVRFNSPPPTVLSGRCFARLHSKRKSRLPAVRIAIRKNIGSGCGCSQQGRIRADRKSTQFHSPWPPQRAAGPALPGADRAETPPPGRRHRVRSAHAGARNRGRAKPRVPESSCSSSNSMPGTEHSASVCATCRDSIRPLRSFISNVLRSSYHQIRGTTMPASTACRMAASAFRSASSARKQAKKTEQWITTRVEGVALRGTAGVNIGGLRGLFPPTQRRASA